MKLKGRNLSQRQRGDDVRLLHNELSQLGYVIADTEVAKNHFGKTSRLAVIDFQKAHGLTEDGIVGVNTARELSVAIAGLHDPKKSEPKNSEPKPSDSATTLPSKSERKSSDGAPKSPPDGEPKPATHILHNPYLIQGQLRQTDGKPAVGLTVSAFDDKDGKETFLGESISDQGGLFKITYDEELFHRLSGGRNGLDMVLRVFDSPHNMHAEWNVVRVTQPVETLGPRVVSWLPTPFSVEGQVFWSDGRPAPNLVVRSFDKDLRNEQELGTAVTDKEGLYQIKYSATKFSRAEKDTADLIVRAYDDKNDVIGSSFPPIIFNSQPEETVDISLNSDVRGLSEYEVMIKELTPLLEDVRLSELVENEEHQDISFLAGETGFNPQLIIWLVQAAKLTNEASSPAGTERGVETHTQRSTLQTGAIPPEVFYGLLRQNLPASLTELLAQDSRLLRSALQRSAQDSIIPPLSALELDEIINRLRALKARLMLKPAGENQQPSLGDLLKTTLLSSDKQRSIANLQVEHDGASEAFWKALDERSEFSKEEVKAVRLVLQLGKLTGNHLPLILELQRVAPVTPVVAPPNGFPNANELRPFAELDVADWKTLLHRPQADGHPIGAPATTPGASLEEKIENYAIGLNQHIEDVLPTAVIAGRLKKDTGDDSPFKSARADLKTFFDNNPSFEFRTTPVDLYLSEGREQKLEDVTDPAAFMAQLKSMQRVFNITPRYPEMRALCVDDLHSALAMVHVGERRFTEKYAEPLGGPGKALEVYRKAEHVHATALNVYMKHSVAFNSPLPYVISGGEMGMPDPQTPVADTGLAANFSTGADWRRLFGSLDLCNCHHCRSLYSPAAYLVDILKFLDDGPMQEDLGLSPLQVLLTRRPDIEHIELTCENTNTQLPYVDLANEILEAAIVPRSFQIMDTVTNSVLDTLDAGEISTWMKITFAQNGYALSDKASLRIETIAGDDSDSEWIILDSGWAFTLKYLHLGTFEGVEVVAWPQTSWRADELRANPEHIHDPAYARLRDAVYPWNLPLNLPLEEVRAYLGHLGVQRYEVIETLLASKAAFETDFAFEYLGLATEEANIITGVTTGGPVGTPTPVGDWDFWGLRDTGNDIVDRNDGTAPHAQDWDVVLQRVSIFLQQSSLSYKELLELLGTYFINPTASAGTPGGRLFGIVSASNEPVDTCNLSKLEIQVVDNDIPDKKEELKTVWNRIHRFVRIWRKLGWTMRDLDKAITTLPKNSDGQSDIDFDALLKNLAHIQRLHIETGLPVVNLLGWWGNIDTVSYVDRLADGEPPVASLYAHLFGNKTVSGQLVGENPDTLSGTLSEKAAAIAAALQISVEDFTLLHADENVIPRIPDPLAPADATKTIPDDQLSLVNLSRLYRHATLAKVLKLPIRTYLTTLGLVDGAPFVTTESTIQFIKHIDKIRASRFKIEELDFLLRHRFSATSDIDAIDDVIPTVLDAMRDDLRNVAAENTFVAAGMDDNAATSDPNGELTRKNLALLNWDPVLIEQAIAVLGDSATYEVPLNALPAGMVLPNDTGTYEATLNALPAGFVFPSLIASVVTYDETAQKLKALRFLTQAERTMLLNASTTDLSYQNAVGALFKLQDELKGKVSYNTKAGKLRFVGTMTPVRQTRLKDASAETDYQDAVDALFKAPRAFILRNMRTFSVQNFKAPLDTFPETVKFPTALTSKAYHDVAAKELRFIGAMTEAERDTLLNLSSNATDPRDTLYKTAINTLFSAPDNIVPRSDDSFLITFGPNNHAATLFDNPTATPEDRFLLVLKELLPYLQTTLSETVVKQRLGGYLKLDATAIDGLLKKWVKSQRDPQEKAIVDFLDPVFVDSNPNVKSSKDAFPDQFKSFLLFHKIAILILKFNMTPRQLQWLFDSNLNVKWLDLNALPLDATAQASALFQGWERLVELFQLRDALPRGETLLTDIFTTATAPGAQSDPVAQLDKVLKILSKGTEWEMGSLKSLSVSDFAGSGSVSAFVGESALLRLSVAFAMLKRLGASADQCLAWAKPSPTADDARALKSVVRAKYDDAQWLELAKALRDPLRERQRSALVAYLVQKLGVRDANELYDDFLIDVEMSPCMMTTRIKQAISAVQLFVQRSLMNLEKPDVSLTTDDAKEWSQWRKWYRVWEANRKVLLYAENWIEPELRDDKSPFFKELENDLLQDDVTMDTAETAFLHYLEKLKEVARLDIVGLYHQQEPATDNTGTGVDILHVFGRTFAPPHIYYYRRRTDSASWTAWEKLEADIQGNHLIPLIWNRRLYLFWATFTKKQKDLPITMPVAGGAMAVGKRTWEIQLAWCEYKNGKWSPKKQSKPYLSESNHPDIAMDKMDESEFSFKSRVVSDLLDDQQLFLDCYGPVVPPSPAASSPFTKERLLFSLDKQPPPIKEKENFASAASVLFKLNGTATAVNNAEIVVRITSNPNGPVHARLPVENDPTVLINGDEPAAKKYYFFSSAVNEVVTIVKETQKREISQTLANKNGTHREEKGLGDVYTVNLKQSASSSASSAGVLHLVSFPFEDSQGNISRPLIISNPTTRLEPLAGTRFVNMMMVEAEGQNLSNALGNSSRILKQTPGTFRLLVPHQTYVPTELSFPFFYQDELRTYLASFIPATNGQATNKIRFSAFHHLAVRAFTKSLNRFGIRGLLTLANQRLIDVPIAFDEYQPDTLVDSRLPREDVDFKHEGAYSIYNWELFFHIPFLIATQLSKNQRFEEAQKWFHYIFDPTATDSLDRPGNPGPERFWRVKPFYDEAMPGIQTLEALIAEGKALKEQVKEWRANPFNPHAVARLRFVAYMKAVVMCYIDNLIAWGDQLFRRGTIESINEATQLYILAAQMLGKRPDHIPARAKAKLQTFRTLDDESELDSLSNAVVEIESFLPPSVAPAGTGTQGGMPLPMPFFCITGNPKLLGYWDTVSDRLFKIRHCMDIEGVVRSLPMFDSPIDPGLLVRAAAAGVDLASALGDINAPLPNYRFNVMVQKATELCNDIKSLGSSLLSALEKRDAEALALLRSTHEIKLLNAVRMLKQQQVEEANETLDALEKGKELTTLRRDYYRDIAFMNEWETVNAALAGAALILQSAEAAALALAGGLHLVPNAKIGAPPSLGATYGGENVGQSGEAFGLSLGQAAAVLNSGAAMAATIGGHHRRFDDWKLQERLANKELEQIDKQIAAAHIRKAIAERDLSNHDLQIDDAKEVDAYLHDKFTNRQLYDWMVGQISSIYFQSYQLAYDVAKRAERTYRYELGLRDSNFIQFGYWDSLKKGLLSGERLYHDLKRMDVAYLDQNKREYEITKHISLITIDPISLVKLKETGECFVSLPEALFDIDYPGHYMRRVKSISVTIPCVTGPYAGINCTLTQLNSSIRHANTLSGGQYRRGGDDTRFSDSFGSIQSIVTSSGQNDSGLFEANMRDERYLPFEGQGAISTWRIQLPDKFKSFDYDTISEVVLHLKYTAREGGKILRDGANAAVDAIMSDLDNSTLARFFSAKHEFPTEWYRFLHPTEPGPGASMNYNLRLDLTQERFPFHLRGRNAALQSLKLFLKLKEGFEYNDTTPFPFYSQPLPTKEVFSVASPIRNLPFKQLNESGPLPKTLSLEVRSVDLPTAPADASTWWQTVQINGAARTRLNPEAIEDIWVVCLYSSASGNA